MFAGSTGGSGGGLCCGALAYRSVVRGGTWQQECRVEQGTSGEVCLEDRGLVVGPVVAVLVIVVLVVVAKGPNNFVGFQCCGAQHGLKRWLFSLPDCSREPAGEAAAAESARRPGRARVGCHKSSIAVRRWLPNIVVDWRRRLQKWWRREAKVLLLRPGVSRLLAALVVGSWTNGSLLERSGVNQATESALGAVDCVVVTSELTQLLGSSIPTDSLGLPDLPSVGVRAGDVDPFQWPSQIRWT